MASNLSSVIRSPFLVFLVRPSRLQKRDLGFEALLFLLHMYRHVYMFVYGDMGCICMEG